MNVGMLALVGSLAAGGQPGPLPVPGMGPPGAVGGLPGQMLHYPHPAMGLPIPAPVLPAKVLAPQGVRVAAYPGSPLARLYDTPTVLAFRPGYSYRLELSNLPLHPGARLYPEVTVYGTIVPHPGMKYMDYPIPLTFSAADIERALAGSVITKVIYLENPEKAVPFDVAPDAPIEFPNVTEQEAIKNALANGRLVAIVRLGAKQPEPQWLAATAIDGTILLPGERHLRSPLFPPTIPYYTCPLFDPLLGPKPATEECFPDGGDRGDYLGIGPNNRLGGLNPTDVGVEYTIKGQRRVTTSNVVCICSPRFMIQRAELTPEGVFVPLTPLANVGALGPGSIYDLRAPMAVAVQVKPTEFDGRIRPMAFVGRVGTAFFVGTTRPQAVGQVEGIKVVGVVVEPEELTAYPGCPLTVIKEVDPSGPVPAGEIVTFTIRYANTGSKPISDVVISDSLSGRLEYVVGSQQTDRAANFSALPNEAGSVVLRWEIPGTMLPGQKGVVKFKAKVR
jgi:uncharacterized repeat protein (TIGR01451 family)